MLCLHTGLISWRSVLQSTPALSTIEAGYMAVIVVSKEAIWLRGLVNEIELNKNQSGYTVIVKVQYV